MDTKRFENILSRFSSLRIALVGDFFLDRYLMIDPALDEISIETGKTAYQVVAKRPQPGAAGTVCNNLHALNVGTLFAVTVVGDDGEGYELRKELTRRGVNIDRVLIDENRFTPTYTKPMRIKPGGDEELNREDIKNRKPLSPHLEEELIGILQKLISEIDALIVADQVQERNCGIITDRIRETLADLGKSNPDKLIFADSRERIGEFRHITTKPNRFEVMKAIHGADGEASTSKAIEYAEILRQRTGKPVFLTLDKEGICPITDQGQFPIPCPPVTGPIDIVGAGDSTTAGIVSSLASGATPAEAAVVGNLVASITIRQLGTTGTATREQVMAALHANESLYRDLA